LQTTCILKSADLILNGQSIPEKIAKIKLDASMPIYEYTCKTCSGTFEFVQKMNDVALTKRPSCMNESCLLEKIPSRFFGQIKRSEKTQIIEETQALPSAPEPKETLTHVCAKYCDLHG